MRYEWLNAEKVSRIDPELGQFLNSYHLPELFLDGQDFGLRRDSVVLRPHTLAWKRLYEFEEIEIRHQADEYFVIEHIGSTAVEHLLAKPIIDILIGLHSLHDADRLIAQLGDCGYRYRGEHGIPGRYYFTKGTSQETFFHIHAYDMADRNYTDHLKVRDTLRHNAELRLKYELYKQSFANSSRTAYTENKHEIMQAILAV